MTSLAPSATETVPGKPRVPAEISTAETPPESVKNEVSERVENVVPPADSEVTKTLAQQTQTSPEQIPAKTKIDPLPNLPELTPANIRIAGTAEPIPKRRRKKRWQAQGLTRGTERFLTGTKNIVRPYYYSRRDFLDILRLKWFDKDWAEARERGHGWIPKAVCAIPFPLGSGNYMGRAIDWLTGPLAHRAWETRQTLNQGVGKVIGRPARAIGRGMQKVAYHTGRLFGGTEAQDRRGKKWGKFLRKFDHGIDRLDAWIRKPVDLRRDPKLSFQKKKQRKKSKKDI